ncbi:MAG: AAA family ATPase [Acidobacteriota bacterium]
MAAAAPPRSRWRGSVRSSPRSRTPAGAKGAARATALRATRAAARLYEPSVALLPGQTESAVPYLPAEEARIRLNAFLAQTLAAAAPTLPLLIVVDDLHWADELTLGFLRHLWQRVPDLPIAVLGTYRVEDAGESLRALASEIPTLTVKGLDPIAVGAIVRDMLSLPAPPEDLVAFLVRTSEGNPLFVAEYLRDAMAARLLERGPDGRWRVRPGDAPGPTEPRRERLGRSSPCRLRCEAPREAPRWASRPAAAAADQASVLGREVDAALLQAALALSEGRSTTRSTTSCAATSWRSCRRAPCASSTTRCAKSAISA